MHKCYLLLFIICLVNFGTFAQKIPNISGYWNGVAEVPLGQDLIVEYTFTQRGAILTGFSKSLSLDGNDSARTVFSGTAKAKSIDIRQTRYEYKTSAGCLSNIKLVYSKEDGQEKLTGKWSGSMSVKTCPPGTGGKMELLKVVASPTEQLVSRTPVEVATPAQSDSYGIALYEELQERKYYSLLIGIDDYVDDGIQDLDEPVSDMEKLHKILNTNYTFTPDNTVALRNPTRDEIIDAFDQLSMKITPKDQLLIFYAGHGIWDERLQQGYWLPSDARTDSKARWLSNSTIRDYIGGIDSKHTLLITDACFSGSIFKERSVSFGNSKAVLERYKLPSRKAMTSGTLKTVPDKSVFITYLLKNLVNNDQSMISAEDLFSTFKTGVINNSPNGQVPQYGAIGQVGDEGGDFIFLRRPDN